MSTNEVLKQQLILCGFKVHDLSIVNVGPLGTSTECPYIRGESIEVDQFHYCMGHSAVTLHIII